MTLLIGLSAQRPPSKFRYNRSNSSSNSLLSLPHLAAQAPFFDPSRAYFAVTTKTDAIANKPMK